MARHGHTRMWFAAAYRLHCRPLFLASVLLLAATGFGQAAGKKCTTYWPSASAFPITWTMHGIWTSSDGPPTTASYSQYMLDPVETVGVFGLKAANIFTSCNGAFTPATGQWVQQPTPPTNFYTYYWNVSLDSAGTLTFTYSGLSYTPPTGTWPTATSFLSTENATYVFAIPTGDYTITQTDSQSVTFIDGSGKPATANEAGSGGADGVVPVSTEPTIYFYDSAVTATQEVALGQLIILSATPDFPGQTQTWTVPGDTVVSYDSTTNKAGPPVYLTDLTQPSLSFYWTKAGDQTVAYTFQDSAGQTGTAKATFKVKGPSPSVDSQLGSPQVVPAVGGRAS
jgi:hypothetical protein